jgi:hypothetical protein
MEIVEMKEIITSGFGDAEYPLVSLVSSSASRYADVSPALLNFLINSKNMPGIYVSLNKPYIAVKRILEPQINLDMMFVIDGTTKLTGGQCEKNDRCLFIENISNLTDITFILDQALDAITSERKFIVFDSLTTLLAYNSEDAVFKFLHYITGRMRMVGADGVFITLNQKSDMEFQSKLSMFCDKIIKIDDDLEND